MKDASIKEIRKAYKQLALTMHPDKSDDPNAHEKFSEITRIYETLKDDELRKKYDRHGFITSTGYIILDYMIKSILHNLNHINNIIEVI